MRCADRLLALAALLPHPRVAVLERTVADHQATIRRLEARLASEREARLTVATTGLCPGRSEHVRMAHAVEQAEWRACEAERRLAAPGQPAVGDAG